MRINEKPKLSLCVRTSLWSSGLYREQGARTLVLFPSQVTDLFARSPLHFSVSVCSKQVISPLQGGAPAAAGAQEKSLLAKHRVSGESYGMRSSSAWGRESFQHRAQGSAPQRVPLNTIRLCSK